MYHIGGDREGTIEDHRKRVGGRVVWDPKFRRGLRDWELEEAEVFFEWLNSALFHPMLLMV